MKRNQRGFTLLEVILTIMIMSLVYLVVSNVFTLTIRTNRIANNEFDLQSNMRVVSESLNQSIKFSPAVFTLKKETFEKEKKPGWRYFGIEEEKDALGNLTGAKQVVEYIPIIEKEEIINGETVVTYKTDAPTHTRKLLIDEPEDTNFNLYFTKDISAENGKLLEFVIEGIQDNSIQRKMTVKTQLQALNAMVVEHAGNPAVAIAYKEEVPGKRVKGTQEAYAVITLVLDKSGSMGTSMGSKSRIQVLNDKTNQLISDLKEAGDKIYISVIPYDTRVSGYNMTLPNFVNINDMGLVSLTRGGNTNTGEALLKSYQMLINRPGLNIPAGAKVNYYNILLTDGDPTEFSYYQLRNDHRTFQTSLRDTNNFIRTDGDDFYYRDKWSSLSYIRNSRTYNINYNSRADDPGSYFLGIFFPGWGEYSMNYTKRIAKEYISTSPLNIKSYIIGFGSGNDELSKEIASYCVGLNSKVNNPLNKPNEKGEQTKAYYSATSAEELDIVYSELTEMIKGDMWHVMGPY